MDHHLHNAADCAQQIRPVNVQLKLVQPVGQL